jgi:PTH1 family peptidyl-tRNA hydrolase
MWLIAGLGNPTEKYDGTRHNVGFAVLDAFARGSEWNATFQDALVTRVEPDTMLLKPQSFMNNSGVVVANVLKKNGLNYESLIVVHDDVSLPVGKVKLSRARGAGGNNGVVSVIATLKSNAFIRVRVGIAPTSFFTGETKTPKSIKDFVLKKFGRREIPKIEKAIETAQKALEIIMKEGIEKAMNTCQ